MIPVSFRGVNPTSRNCTFALRRRGVRRYPSKGHTFGYRRMGIHISPHSRIPQPEDEKSSHRSYDRVHENWATSEERGSLTLREFVSSPDQPLHINCDHLVELLGDAQNDATDFGRWVFDQASSILANIQPDASYIGNNDFSHTAKYLFCAACFKPPLRSVLDHSDNLATATELVDRAVSFCEMSQSLGTTPLIIRGIIASNIRAWVERGKIDSFHFRPDSLNSEGFSKLLVHAREQESERALARPVPSASGMMSSPQALNEQFCAVTTPRQFLMWAFAHNVALPVPELADQLKKLLAAHLGDEATHFPFLLAPKGDDRGSPNSTQPFEGPSIEFRRGVYVDVFGTLINHDGSPNHRLIQVLKDLMTHVPPRPVFLVSDSQDEEIDRALSFLDERPPVIHKDSLYASELEYLIDNSEPHPQGLHARHHLLPDQAVAQGKRLVADDAMYFST